MLIFERLWRETGCQQVVRKLLATRHHHFDVERAVFMTVLHRLMVSGSDRSALAWRRDQAIDGTEALKLQHLYRAMGWLGEALGEREPDAPSPRRIKDLIEEELFARRRDLFTALDLVFFDTTSLFFTGNGGDTLGQYGKSKDRRSDCKQMVLGMVIDGDGIPVCTEMWPGNATDVTTLDQVAQRLQNRFGVRRVCLVADGSDRPGGGAGAVADFPSAERIPGRRSRGSDRDRGCVAPTRFARPSGGQRCRGGRNQSAVRPAQSCLRDRRTDAGARDVGTAPESASATRYRITNGFPIGSFDRFIQIVFGRV